ncbi:iron ABC transporter iron-binding protein [Streptococcus pneumoniae]|nr:iron ABC transporter iron-binding protein [Streptococcus pneumoniae]
MTVGLSYEDPAVKLLNDGANIKVVYPKEGTVFLPASAAIVKKSKNMENAKKFIDFIISQEVQDTLGTTTTNRPVRKNAKTSENMKPIDKIKTLTEDYDYVIKNNPNFKLKLATQKKFTWRLVVQAFFRVVVNPIFDKSYFFRSRFLGSFR